jgi:hypothetical protein
VDTCVCGSIEKNYLCPNKLLLPGHEHLSINEKGKMFFVNKQGQVVPFNGPPIIKQ